MRKAPQVNMKLQRERGSKDRGIQASEDLLERGENEIEGLTQKGRKRSKKPEAQRKQGTTKFVFSNERNIRTNKNNKINSDLYGPTRTPEGSRWSELEAESGIGVVVGDVRRRIEMLLCGGCLRSSVFVQCACEIMILGILEKNKYFELLKSLAFSTHICDYDFKDSREEQKENNGRGEDTSKEREKTICV
ncbi:uncharacterized protein G2W53_036112 [Senna tora]|uniref:Uncharacterized protein n=1 Tax=Senna tora TaxID=362788 RepID=A0A834T4G8_9FABA|nr:uncharacterized protein G2W53_036112 [Senna tora]